MKNKYFQKILNVFNLIFIPKKINHELISDNALNVIDNLKNNNFEAYLVGGAVRDKLLNNQKILILLQMQLQKKLKIYLNDH